MKYYYIYKITCTEGSFKDKFYFGQHTTENLDDGYKGSGRKLRDYYKKYPNGYKKEIISFYNSTDELNKAEYDIIYFWLNNEMCLNLKEGGGNNKFSEESKQKMSSSQKYKKHSKESKNKVSKKMKMWHLTHEHPLKNKTAWNKGFKMNNISNTKWMNKNGEDKRIPIDEINIYINKGYKLGRGHLQRK